MTNDYEEGPWAPAEIFVGVGGTSEKGSHMVKRAPPLP